MIGKDRVYFTDQLQKKIAKVRTYLDKALYGYK